MGGVAWTEEEDNLLKKCIQQYGEGKWHRIPHLAGLNRCRKNCRLRWLNYLRPNIKSGDFSDEEVQMIVKLHKLLGNRWPLIAGRLPGRTGNHVKNYWNCHLSKQLKALETEERQMVKNVEVIIPQPRNINSSSISRSQGDASHPPGQQESSIFLPTFDVDGKSQMLELEEENIYSCLDQQGIVGVLPMNFQFEEVKATSNGGSGSLWDWDDLLFDMDLYNDSLDSSNAHL